MQKTRWILIVLFLIISVLSNFELGAIDDYMPILSVLSLTIAVFLHGVVRYGIKNMVIFLLITWIVSHFFEALSIQVGFPFGHYFYDKLVGPRLFQVPLIIMLGYFSMAYVSWTLGHILLRQNNKTLAGSKIVTVPFISTFIMVIWDLCMDPLSSTVSSLWVWKEGGAYFGVPLQNYFGWFFVVYIIFQLFGLYISRYDVSPTASHANELNNKSFWLEASILYGIQGLSQILAPFTAIKYQDIFYSMALVTIFTMIFLTILSAIEIYDNENARVNDRTKSAKKAKTTK